MEESLQVFHSTEPYNWLSLRVEKWYIAKTFPKKVKADSICSLLISFHSNILETPNSVCFL